MTITVAKWGNSLAVRLPRHIAEGADLTDGSPVEVEVQNGSVVLTPTKRAPTLDELLAQMKPEHRHPETDWGAPQGVEVW